MTEFERLLKNLDTFAEDIQKINNNIKVMTEVIKK